MNMNDHMNHNHSDMGMGMIRVTFFTLIVIVLAFLGAKYMLINNKSSTVSSTMDMGGMGGMGGMEGHGGHGGHGGFEMDMNDTDRTCSGHMLMFFHTGKCEYILFESLRTSDVGGLVGACVAVFALAVIYEGLKVVREVLLQKSMLAANRYAVSNGSSSQDTMVISNKNVGIHMMSGGHFLQTFLHMIQVFISYCLMLVFMTYNAWLCLSVILGAGLGYFMFGWRKAIVVDINEHCH